MTPKQAEGHRYWTPRLSLANMVFSGGMVVLWWCIQTGITDIKNSLEKNSDDVKSLTAQMADRHTTAEIWRTATKYRIDDIDIRLVKVERKVGL